MQVTQADSGNRKRPGVNNTSPPYSDKMKKYIKSKIDHNETTSRCSPPSPSDPYNSNINMKERVKPQVQPPLPLDPPPPDEPPNMNIELKKEIVDIGYQSPGENSPDALSQGTVDLKSNDDDESEKPRPMCRDYIRGKCVRPGTCKFSHKCDISQLVGVYTFCRNYQNSVCTLPNCKYVHASVFEEQHFYRTAELPAHALAHHKKPILPPPPPPPPPEEAPPSIPAVFKIPPPPLRLRMTKPPPPIRCIPTSKLEARPFLDMRDNLPPSTSPLKREWPCIENFPGSSRGIRPDLNAQKRCKNCKYIELRAELMKEKCEKLQKASLEMRNKIDLLNKRREKLYATLVTLFKPTYQAKSATGGGGSLSSPNSGERQTWFFEQMNGAMNSNLMSSIQQDTNRFNMNGNPNLSSLVSKLLQVCRQHMLSDPSRKT